MTPQDIITFLHRHPDFFDEHPDLLAQLTVPHPTNGNAISLTERQLLTLREKLAQVQGKLAELVAFGEENDVIAERVHRLILSLLAAEDFEAVAFAVYSHLQDDFAVPHVRMRIWNSILKRPGDEFGEVSENLRFFAGDLRQPYCGPVHNEEIRAWFGETGAQVASQALIPLRRDAQVFGLLALGSEDPERFFPEMGTMYVERIGDLVGAAVLKQLG